MNKTDWKVVFDFGNGTYAFKIIPEEGIFSKHGGATLIKVFIWIESNRFALTKIQVSKNRAFYEIIK